MTVVNFRIFSMSAQEAREWQRPPQFADHGKTM
jgi:hypothetical protein